MGSLQTTPPPELEVDVVVTDVEAVVVVTTDDLTLTRHTRVKGGD